MKEKDVILLLDKQYGYKSNGESYARFPKFRTGTGYGHGTEQEIDYLAISLWKSNYEQVIAFEIKLGRGDFLKEMKHPEKRKYALLFSNQFYFVAPKDMIKPDELPIEAGLMEIEDAVVTPYCLTGKCLRTRIQAPWRDDARPNWHFVRSIARRTVHAELK